MATWLIWCICAVATIAVITRPYRLPEAIWAVAGAALLLILGLIPIQAALAAILKGTDVYLFLFGMMLLSEVARREGLFDWVAATAVNHAKGSKIRLFSLVYGAGIVVTAFLSNDATAVVMTPAVFAAARKARCNPLPLLFACAFIANAASFILPISNPANLVLYGGQMPALGAWFQSFALPSLAAIIMTFVALRFTEREGLQGTCANAVAREPLSTGGWSALAGIVTTAALLLILSAASAPLGLPTALAGLGTVALVCVTRRKTPTGLITTVSWSILPLVAGLFVLVEALNSTGVIAALAEALANASSANITATAAGGGTILAVASNAINNLPTGLIASTAIAQAHVPKQVIDSLLIGVDLGPNLSITGSLATILWLAAIRREGENVGFARFFCTGVVAMPLALMGALALRLVF